MDSPINLLLTAPPQALLASVRRMRPDWRIGELGDGPPDKPLDGKIWCFVDWICPRLSGLEVCRRLRESRSFSSTHLIMVLENDDIESRRRALQAGADDYLVGPLDADCLIARIESGTGKATSPGTQRLLHHGALKVDCAAHQVRFENGVIALRPNEFRLLVHFLTNRDQVYSRRTLIEQLGKDSDNLDERTVDVWIGRLRRALVRAGVPDPLRTVRSLGYVLDSLD
jgi:two-component system phosphate regulon response regulator PhoB